jgi:hypothetical protein
MKVYLYVDGYTTSGYSFSKQTAEFLLETVGSTIAAAELLYQARQSSSDYLNIIRHDHFLEFPTSPVDVCNLRLHEESQQS